jgi:DNA-binding transcriptional MerR regulator
MVPPDVRWTLDELCEEVAKVLAKESAGPADGRVREVPDRRTVRYYTTLGLLDRPAAMRGRTAYYGKKHLWQLLAIKRLQAQGRSLSQVQQSLLGLSEEELRRLAGVPDEPRAGRAERSRSREDFWRTPPAPAEARPAVNADGATPLLQGVRLAPGVVLLVEATREVREEDRIALAQAAGVLIELLKTRGLIEEDTA